MLLYLQAGLFLAVMIATGTAVTARTTVATLATRTTLTLYISLGLRHEHAMRELVLAGLRVYLHELNLNLVALLDAGFLYSLKAFPVYLGDVEHTVLAGHNLHEATIRHD